METSSKDGLQLYNGDMPPKVKLQCIYIHTHIYSPPPSSDFKENVIMN